MEETENVNEIRTPYYSKDGADQVGFLWEKNGGGRKPGGKKMEVISIKQIL